MNTDTKSTVGKELKAARRVKNWSVERAAYATKLRADVINKIESDRYDLLPNPAYARGFVRIYARELGLDPVATLKKLNGVVEETEENTELLPETLEVLPSPVLKRRKTPNAQNIGLFLITAIVLGGLILGGIQLYRIWPTVFGNKPTPSLSELTKPLPLAPNSDKTADDAEVRRAEPVAKTESANPPAEGTDATVRRAEAVSTPTNRLQLSADEDCWVKVQTIAGDKETTVFEDVIPGGSSIPQNGENAWVADAFIVTIRDTARVNIIYNNQNFGKYDRQGHQTFRIPGN